MKWFMALLLLVSMASRGFAEVNSFNVSPGFVDPAPVDPGLTMQVLPRGATSHAKKMKPHDVYLRDGLMCKRCTAELMTNKLVRLRDTAGRQTLVRMDEIIGINTHPIIRSVMIRSLHGIGNPGPLIVPYAFEDSQEYVCKYCYELKRETP
jgi:hypothetical protein